jgi:2,4-dienoyl-CoA reductase-like NADH-dependent reductase (Old Yellow Enzyme family)
MTNDPLFERTELCELTLENSVGLAPMTRVSATEDGRATAEMAKYYAKFADGGFSVLVTEGTYTDESYSQGYLNQPGLVSDEQTESWTQVTDAVHDADAPVLAQLMHAGYQAQGNPYVEGERTIAPSTVRPDSGIAEAYGGSGEFPVAEAASEDDLDDVRASFVEAAENAREAGFEGVELHAANGYLLNEFLASDTNHRAGRYGGDPADRVRFPAEVVSAVADALPEGFVVGVRVSQTKVTDEEYRWDEGEDAAAVFFEGFPAAGADYVHVTEPDITSPAFGDDGPTLAEAAVEYAPEETVVIANGGLGDPDAARDVLDAGADLVTLATGALANPDWPTRVTEGCELDAFDPAEFLAPDATIGEEEVPVEAPTADD